MLGVKSIEHLVQCGSNVTTVRVDQTVADAAEAMRDHKVGCLVVVNESDRIAGILTEQDIVRKVLAARLDPASVAISQIMTRNVIACSPRTELATAERIMAEKGIRHLPIVQGGQLKGMISSRDVMSQQLQEATELLRQHGEILDDIERQYPGITQLRRDRLGRVVI